MDSGFQSLSVELRFLIPNVSGIPDSLSCIPDFKPKVPNFTISKTFPHSGIRISENLAEVSLKK